MKKTKWIVALLSVALVVGMVAAFAVSCGGGTDTTDEPATTVTEAPVTTDNMQNYSIVLSVGMPSNASLFKAYLLPWSEAVAAASNGRVTFDIKDNNSLVKEEQQIDACLSGTSDMTAFQPDWNAGLFPLGELAQYPMLFPTTEVADRVMWDLIAEFGEKEFEDFKLLCIMMIAPANFAGNFELRLPTDVKGKRVRSGGGVETDTIVALGGTPREAATGDVPVMVPQIAFDGLFMSLSYHAWMTNDWAKKWTETAIFYRPIYLVMNREKWDSLPAAVQKVFEDNSGIEASVMYNDGDTKYQADNSSMPNLKQSGFDLKAIEARAAQLGTEVIRLTDDERALWTEALRPVLDGWAERYAGKLPTAEILERLFELVEQYSGGSTAPAADATTTTAQ